MTKKKWIRNQFVTNWFRIPKLCAHVCVCALYYNSNWVGWPNTYLTWIVITLHGINSTEKKLFFLVAKCGPLIESDRERQNLQFHRSFRFTINNSTYGWTKKFGVRKKIGLFINRSFLSLPIQLCLWNQYFRLCRFEIVRQTTLTRVCVVFSRLFISLSLSRR